MIKHFNRKDYNQTFNTETGSHLYYGEHFMDDPDWCQYGPTILDMEISTGSCKGRCHFCYKGNGAQHNSNNNMTIETFRAILSRLDTSLLTQIAFGICDIDTNPDMWSIFAECRSHNVIPNFTCNGLGITSLHANCAASLCGAVAVSIVNKEESFKAIEKFSYFDHLQCNVHFLLSEETYQSALDILDDIKTDPRLKKLNAIVFLQYKPKGNGIGHFHPISSVSQYKFLIEKAASLGIKVGFDSCSAPMYLKYLAEQNNRTRLTVESMFIEPCESGLFSAYLNWEGKFFPCSFSEGIGEWTEGIDVLSYESFLQVWQHEKTREWGRKLIGSSAGCNKCLVKSMCRSCVLFDEVTPCKVN